MRLIDADFVKKALSIFNDREHGDKGFFNGLETCKEIIDNAPTIEAVDVVRCKDCILDREAQCPMKYVTEADDYCSFGERIVEEK